MSHHTCKCLAVLPHSLCHTHKQTHTPFLCFSPSLRYPYCTHVVSCLQHKSSGWLEFQLLPSANPSVFLSMFAPFLFVAFLPCGPRGLCSHNQSLFLSPYRFIWNQYIQSDGIELARVSCRGPSRTEEGM